MAQATEVRVRLLEEYSQHFKNFHRVYELEKLFQFGGERSVVHNRINDTCRFCGNRVGEVKFTKEAHLVSHLLGVRVLHNAECDDCNERFGRYEDSLAKYLGAFRTLTSTRAKEGVPTYKSPDKSFEVRYNKDIGGPQVTIKTGTKLVQFDVVQKKLQLKAKRHTFIPIYVYKSFIKMAYALLPESALKDYAQCAIFLKTDHYDGAFSNHPYFKLYTHFIPGPLVQPISIFMWKRRGLESVPTRIMVLYCQNLAMQVFLPFCTDGTEPFCDYQDQEHRDFKLTMMIAPPVIDKGWCEIYGKPTLQHVDLSTTTPTSTEQDIGITFLTLESKDGKHS